MSTTTHAPPKQIDPSASLHAQALGQAKNHGRLMRRRIIVVGAGQRTIVDEDPPIGNGRAMSVLFRARRRPCGLHRCQQGGCRRYGSSKLRPKAARRFADIVDVADGRSDCARRRALRENTRRPRTGLALNVGISSGLSLPKNDRGSLGQGFGGQRPPATCCSRKRRWEVDGARRRDCPDGRRWQVRARQWPQPGLRILKGRADCAWPRHRPGRRGTRAFAATWIAPGFMDTPMGRDASRKARRIGAV